jgi:transposase
MNVYSEDLRKKKIVEAVERGMPKIEAARTFGMGISSVKRYVATYHEGSSLAPKKRPPGSKPKLDEGVRKLLEADLEERPTATLPQRCEFLRACGVEASDSTVSRVLKRLGWTRKKDCEYCDHGVRDVLPVRSDPKKRGLRAFRPIRQPIGRASWRHRSESHVTS